ncbi:hypothetical protein F4774DRAFT_405354 [Daldinia eschscholtzii]|nr:hypothetical protein F4774DRAFT_405354 [Daldinia eschscholtzii]
MDQDSRSPEPRERAVSSEPCSTRPNPFDDGDSSSRKRRRTSLSGSRSSSVETIPSPGDEKHPPDSNIMRVDSPEQLPPSTPARSEPAAEPVSSKVTINLRNADSLENTPSSPPSPTPAQSFKDSIKASVEEPEVNMIQVPSAEDASSPASELDSPEAPIIPNDDDLLLCGGSSTLTALPEDRVAEFSAAMLDFPYHTNGESYHETVVRLADYFRQQSSHVDDALHLLSEWLNTYLSHAHIEFYPMVMEAYQENRDFWQTLPDLFFSIGLRHGSSKSNHTRDIVSQMFAQIARLTRFLLVVDCRTLLLFTKKGGNDFDLVSPNFLRLFGNLSSKEENNTIINGYISANHPGVLEPLDILQARGDSLQAQLSQFTELITSSLTRCPKKVMDNLVGIAWLSECLLRDSHRKLSPPNFYSPAVLDRSRKNMAFGLKFFATVSEAMDIVIDKFITNLGSDTAISLINSLASIFRFSLFNDIIEAARILENHRETHPDLQDRFRQDALSLEWRMRICCKLVKSRQMQLRVAATSHLCEDLVVQWRTYMERQDLGDDYLAYLRYLSSYLVKTGIVDYLLGPTCHPEITQASFNIVGFLAVTKTYTAAQTELLWQTLTSTQDPRISDAIVRMMSKVVSLLEPESLTYMCEKFYSLPIESFSSCMRDLFDQVTKQMQEKTLPYQLVPLPPYKICVRLLQDSSILGPQGSVLYPEIHNFALSKFGTLLHSGPDPAGRESIWMSCVEDIAAKSRTTSGSLHVLSTLIGNTPALQMLISDHNLTRLLVDELESTIANAKGSGFAPVYASQIGHARRRIISAIIVHHGSTIDSELGRRLWDLLVGNGAACQDDRKAAWDDLNGALKRTHLDNPFLNACLREYLPQLPPSCYCAGSLAFVREAIIPLANDVNGMVLDDEDSVKSSGLELLWQMILTAPRHTIEETAISTLVDDIYVDSKTILSYPLHRARRVHFALAQRCLQQLKCAAQRLKEFGDSKLNGDGDSTATASKEQHEEHELQFTRSLQVLIALLRSLQTRPHFAAPDLRSLMLQAPSPVDGESADLKYQSFDGDDQTDIKSLDIGLKNTAASLLASLREVTGFDNYRLYYRGQPLAPSESAICKSIEELDIKTGLILVKKETGITTSPRRIKPGASPLDIEILGHFKDLWEYLSMEEKLAREIYHFLVSLPADDSILTAFEDPATSYRDVFPLGQPFKSLYALHALREYLSTRRLKSSVMQVSSQDCEAHLKSTNDHQDASARAMSLVIAAICDSEVVERGSSEALQLKLSLELVESFIHLLEEMTDTETITQLLNPNLLQRLSAMLLGAASAQMSQLSIELITRSFEAILESCTKSEAFWKGFRDQVGLQSMVQRLVLDDARPIVRKSIAGLITAKSLHEQLVPGAQALDFAELFWPIIFKLVHRAVTEPNKCEETFSLSFQLLHKLNKEKPGVVNLPTCLRQCGELLLSHTTTEDIAHPDRDIVAYGLIMILSIGMAEASARKERVQFHPSFTSELFSRHLFPPEDEDTELVPKVILNTPSRSILYDIILALVRDDATLCTGLLRDLNTLTSFRVTEDGMDTYKYELPQAFERSSAIRSSCGYSGMRNLSNTCYLNSLFTQLFMNIGFRRFILERRVRNPLTHSLLQETQALFAFLQDSRRRYVEPSSCVSQIMTYDEAPIDIHNQMDVDEFYSLLFDRWEAQLPLEADKKKLRSIYGGELVQQVKSKECQHISERIEPFSAIQCDIKGKAGLEESLQAYVDGEIMEGDNKYKCSDCDRHVDAVKRACLKDIPDNLIFHLKRFDFNLRTLTRSKINDYFPFPNEINMQPYTIEHLSDPSGSTEPDMFELVGILVHSGTAESGHYYSYIRERPTASSTPSWVEFNDEIVTSWEPSQMENACFGGPDYRPQFEAGAAYEKVYSAYMLFYQRSTSLQKEQEMLRASGQIGPFRCSVPRNLESQVKEDNWSIVQRHCLYDPAHMPFVYEVLANVWSTACSKDHSQENLAMQTALGHLDQIASRAKDLPDYDQLKHLLVKVCQRCPMCCFAFFDYFSQHKDALRMLLQRNSDIGVRQDIGKMLIFVLLSIKNKYPEEYGLLESDVDMVVSNMVDRHLTIVDMTLDIFLYVWETFHTRLNSWPEYFGTMLEFARMGRYEALAFLDRDFLLRLIMVISVDQVFDLPPQYARLLTVVSRRSARPPNYENIIALIDELLAAIDSVPGPGRHPQDAHGRLLLGLQGEPVPFTMEECNILHRDWVRGQANVFTEKLISLNQNPMATDSIIKRLISFAPMTDFKVFTTLRLNITGELTSHMVSPFLRVAVTYCRYSTNYENVYRLINHISNHCRSLQNAEGRAFFDFQRDIFNGARSTGETSDIIQLRNLENIPKWAPGLLGYIDHSVSDDVDNFLQEKLFRHGPLPAFGEINGALDRSRAIILVIRRLAVSCLEYLRDTYVSRAAQAAKYTVDPLDRVLKKCEPYFTLNEEIDDGLGVQYMELRQVVLEPMVRLTVDEIEEDGSDWEQSVGSSEQMDNLTDLSMQIDRDLV